MTFDKNSKNNIKITDERLQNVITNSKKIIQELYSENKSLKQKEPIAVCGLSCRYPGGGNSPNLFWNNLKNNLDSVKEIPKDRFDFSLFYSNDINQRGKSYTKYAHFIDDIDCFDPLFFGITPVEAKSLDPQHRLLLEVSWEALENAGMNYLQIKGSNTGVFIAISGSDYQKLTAHPENYHHINSYSGTGTMSNTACGRLSYFYDLHGPCLSIDTACSSSLTAIITAMQNLQNHTCNMAIVGGVQALITPDTFIGLSKIMGISKDGRCRTFDDSADGFGRGEGCGVVILKRLSDALNENDPVMAVIQNGLIKHDGKSNGLAAPNGLAQEDLISKVLAMSNFNIEDIDYIETHGTGTPLGDPIEIQSLANVFESRNKQLLVGAVKSNIGHLEAGSAMAGFIKIILALQNQELPANINFKTKNKHISWDDIKISVVLKNTPWYKSSKKRIAGLSAFGIGGTIGHLLIEDPPVFESNFKSNTVSDYILTLSALRDTDLSKMAHNYLDFIEENKSVNLADICYTSNLSRASFSSRIAIVGSERKDFINSLSRFIKNNQDNNGNEKNTINQTSHSKTDITFLFTGQGSIYPDMGKFLYDNYDSFRQAFDNCNKIFKKYLEIDIHNILYNSETIEVLTSNILASQAIIFSVQYALVQFWKKQGIEPKRVLGHSIGEIAAACTAGIMSLENAIKMVSIRAQLVQEIPSKGKMAGLLTNEINVRKLIKDFDKVSIAALNGPENITISGNQEDVEKVLARAKEQRIFIEELNISHAFHSSLMEPHINTFYERIKNITLKNSEIEFVSSQRNNSMLANNHHYWSNQILNTVDFQNSFQNIANDGNRIFIEIGGMGILSGLASEMVKDESRKDFFFLPSLRKGISGQKQILQTIKQLYLLGIPINWKSLHEPFKFQKIILPNYPFQKKRYWIDITEHSAKKLPDPDYIHEASGNRSESYINKINHEYKEITKVNNKFVSEKKSVIENNLNDIIFELAGIELSEINPETDFFSLGLDSLMITQIRQKIIEKFAIDISLNKFLLELTSLNHLMEYINDNFDYRSPDDDCVESKKIEQESKSKSPVQHENTLSQHDSFQHSKNIGLCLEAPEPITKSVNELPNIERVINQQLSMFNEISQNQLNTVKDILYKNNSKSMENLNHIERLAEKSQTDNREKQKSCINSEVDIQLTSKKKPLPVNTLNFSKSVDLRNRGLSLTQQEHLNKLINQFNHKTQKSKEQVQKHRKILADSRASVGFNFTTKELLYPIVGKSSKAAYIWDIDDNKYIDYTMGFGVNLFGHHPSFIDDALNSRPSDDIQLGPRSPLVGEVAELLVEITGFERIAFTNTGTEANMAAIRLARAASGKNKLVIFKGSYHGHSDGTLAMSQYINGKHYSTPISPGIPQSIADEVIIVDYLDFKSLEKIKEEASNIAAVIVEPVQSRVPNVQPANFLKALRQLTKELGIILFFDEMVTGFRLHPRGAQGYFDVDADICTYGKIVGGGMPIGVIAGKAFIMDGIDGGYWQYQDASYPQVDRTFFGGTFCQHPRAMITAKTVLEHIKKAGPNLQNELNKKTDMFSANLNMWCEEMEMSLRISNFGSIFRIDGALDLLFYHLLNKGIYIWEWRSYFLSTAHTNQDIKELEDAIKESVEELDKAGFNQRQQLETQNRIKTNDIKKKDINSTIKADSWHGSLNTLHAELGAAYYPMSSVQRRIFIMEQMDGIGTTYHLPYVMRVKGKFDVKLAEEIFKKLITRHESLRSAFEVIEGHFVQKIIDPDKIEFSVELCDGSNQPIDKLIENFLKPFDLKKPPLTRLCIFSLKEDEYLFLSDSHHIVVDGLSSNILFQEFAAQYNGQNLKPLQSSYIEFLEWEHNYFKSQLFIEHKQFWDDFTSREIPLLELPCDFSRPEKQVFKGDTVCFELDERTTKELRLLAKESSISLFMLLLSTFYVFLYKLTGQEDIIIGTPVGIRQDKKFENIIGMFTNTMVFRNQPESLKSFKQFLSEVKLNCLMTLSNQEYPYEKIVSNIKRDSSRNLLFDAMFMYEDASGRIIDLENCQFTQYKFKEEAMFDFSMDVYDLKNKLEINFTYAVSLFKNETIQRWKSYYLELINDIINSNDKELWCYNIIPNYERNIILSQFNNTDLIYSIDKTFQSIFENITDKNKSNIAVVFENESLSYEELNQRANQLAWYLKENGIDNENIVGIMLPKSLEMIIAVIGVIKAGAAYLPIDCDYPLDRVNYMLNDSKCSVLLGLGNAPDGIDFEGKYHDLSRLGNKLKLDNPPSTLTPQNLMYIIYTSGSTGFPKGVQIEHRHIVHMNAAWLDIFEFNKNKPVILQYASFSFDVFVGDMTKALLNGGTLVVCPSEKRLDFKQVHSLLKEHNISHIEITPAFGVSFFNFIHDNNLSLYNLKTLVFGADSLEASDYKLINKRFGEKIKIMNSYGVTETTIDSSYYYEPFDHLPDSGIVPIGKPMRNVKYYVLGPHRELQPIGINGELYIGGKSVGRGYINKPEMTHERFLDDPFAQESYQSNEFKNSNCTMYKTGDLARFLPDGNIQFLGRIDAQVKIRGYRIELGEIESCIKKISSINEVVVVASDKATPNKFITAYFTCDKKIDSMKIKEELRHLLPDYMIPDFFYELDRLPITPNGKIDRKSLPDPQKLQIDNIQFEAPKTETEKLVTKIFSELLKTDFIGRNHDFFESGGNSLQSIEVIYKFESLGISLRAGDLFRFSRVKDLANFIDYLQRKNNLISDILIAEKMLIERFGGEIKIASYEYYQELIYIYYISEEIIDNKFEFLKFILNNIFDTIHPHYILTIDFFNRNSVAKNAKISNSDLNLLLDLKKAKAFWEIKKILKPIIDKQEDFFINFTKNKVIKTYPAAPIQIAHKSLPFNLSGNTIVYKRMIDIDDLKTAIHRFITEQGLMRSILDNTNGILQINELEVPDSIYLPICDISDYTIETQQKLIAEITNRFFKNEFNVFQDIGYRFILIKQNQRQYILLFVLDHILSDFYSADLMKRELIEYYIEKTEDNKQVMNYEDYVFQVNKGPQSITCKALIEKFKLKEFKDAFDIIWSKIKDNLQKQPESFSYEVQITQSIINQGTDFIQELSFAIFCGFCKTLFETDNLPIGTLYHGRSYENKKFFTIMGEFLDIVPVLVEIDEENPSKMATQISATIKNADEFNVNFIHLLHSQKIEGTQWSEIKNYLTNDILKAPTLIQFNYLGKMDKEEFLIDEQAFKTVMENVNTDEEISIESTQVAMMVEVAHSDTSIKFDILNFFGIDMVKMNKIFEQQVRKIME